VEQVVAEAKHHIANGVEEIILLGQIVNKHPHFVEICKQILTIPGLKRLRYTSPYPTYYSDELLALHENEPKMCPHIHMPLQSGSDIILKKMFRGYNSSQFKEFVDKIRNLKRDISITTDIIVGFCDETEEDFQASLDLVQYAKFDMVYIGKYSTRPGTFAHKKYIDNVPAEVKQDRWTRLNELLREISAQNNKKEIGTQRDVLINKIEKDRI
jgi:tRNA-2-methylthio-N6-dimethylallyladenosine synthase